MSQGHLRRSVFVTGLLLSAIAISACSPEPEPNVEDSITAEESVPMSAEPAEPNDMVIAANDATPTDSDTDASIASASDTGMQLTYACSPELDMHATYKDSEGSVSLETPQGLLTLVKSTADTGAEVFTVARGLDGSTGFTQWRLEGTDREVGTLQTGANANKVTTYDCDILD